MTKAVLPQMLARGHGHVVYIGSVSGITASPGSSLYNATKFGLRGFSNALRQDLYGTGVGVSIVMPGFVRGAGMAVEGGIIEQLPPGVRTVTPEKVARVAGSPTGTFLKGILGIPSLRLVDRAGAELQHTGD